MAVFENYSVCVVKCATMPNPDEATIRQLVERLGLHRTLHALIEVCYAKAAAAEQADVRSTDVTCWRLIANRLTAIEAEADHYNLR